MSEHKKFTSELASTKSVLLAAWHWIDARVTNPWQAAFSLLYGLAMLVAYLGNIMMCVLTLTNGGWGGYQPTGQESAIAFMGLLLPDLGILHFWYAVLS